MDPARSLFTFRFGEFDLALDASRVIMIVGFASRRSEVVPCREVPSGRALRHERESIPLLDLGQFLGQSRTPEPESTVAIVLESGGRKASVLATDLCGIVSAHSDALRPIQEDISEPMQVLLSHTFRSDREIHHLLDADMIVKCTHSNVAQRYFDLVSRAVVQPA